MQKINGSPFVKLNTKKRYFCLKNYLFSLILYYTFVTFPILDIIETMFSSNIEIVDHKICYTNFKNIIIRLLINI